MLFTCLAEEACVRFFITHRERNVGGRSWTTVFRRHGHRKDVD